MTTKPLLIVDGNNILCRSIHTHQELQTSDGRFLGGLYGFINSLTRVAGLYQGEYLPVVCWDGGKCARRLSLAPDYKKRPKKDSLAEPIPEQIRLATLACTAMGIPSFRFKGVEADDIMACLAHLAKLFIIYSSDKDFFQLLTGPGQLMRRPTNQGDVMFAHDSEEIFTGLESRLYLGLMGDSVDNISGVPGVGEGTAKNLILALRGHPHGEDALIPGREPVELLQVVRDALAERRKKTRNWKKVPQHWEDLLLSLDLVDLWRKDLLSEDHWLEVLAGLAKTQEPNWDALQELFNEWEFRISVSNVESMISGVKLDISDVFDMDEVLGDEEDPVEDPTPVAPVPLPNEKLEHLLFSSEPRPEPEQTPTEEEVEAPEKVLHFSLRRGYMEDSSLCTLNLTHYEGFDSVEEGLASLGSALLADLESSRDDTSVLCCQHCHKEVSGPSESTSEDVAFAFEDWFLHGSVGSYNSILGHLEDAGWNLWDHPLQDWDWARAVKVDRAGILVSSAVFPSEGAREWEYCVEGPPGIRVRKNQ